jgi:hypothetical protein
VVVCSKETGLGDCYDALPNDVLGTDYIAASMPAADESSEFMIISHADDNEVTVDIPDGYSHIIELSGQTTTAAGGTITFTLNQRQAFHLAQTSATASMSNVNGYHITSTKQVSVISGNRLYGSNHAVTQLPPTTKAGEKYVLIPVDIDSDGRLTTYIIQPVEAGENIFHHHHHYTLVCKLLEYSSFKINDKKKMVIISIAFLLYNHQIKTQVHVAKKENLWIEYFLKFT